MNFLNKIIKGNCIEVLKQVTSNSIDCIFADPPYFMQTEGKLIRADGTGEFKGCDDKWDKFSSYSEYDKFSHEWLSECKRVLKDTGSIWVIGSFHNIYRIGYIMQNLGFWILNDVIWSKPNAVPNMLGTRFKNSHETLLWCSKSKKNKFVFNYKTMKSLNNGIQEKSVWDIGITIGSERLKDENGKKAHSTQKPEKLLKKIILSSSKVNDIILDPFFGSGTTGAVAKSLHRNWIGIELDDKYINVANKRINNVTPLPMDDIISNKLEVKPPKVSMSKLIDLSLIKVGETLYDKKGDPICEVCEDGRVLNGVGPFSIHKMSALRLGLSNNNGWNYFFVRRGDAYISINEFRYIA